MCSIKLQEILSNKTYPDAGSVLYDMLVAKIDTENNIVLDMTGVVSLPSMFLNTSIGKFIETYGLELLRKKVSFHKISATQANRIKEYIERVSK